MNKIVGMTLWDSEWQAHRDYIWLLKFIVHLFAIVTLKNWFVNKVHKTPVVFQMPTQYN